MTAHFQAQWTLFWFTRQKRATMPAIPLIGKDTFAKFKRVVIISFAYPSPQCSGKKAQYSSKSALIENTWKEKKERAHNSIINRWCKATRANKLHFWLHKDRKSKVGMLRFITTHVNISKRIAANTKQQFLAKFAWLHQVASLPQWKP